MSDAQSQAAKDMRDEQAARAGGEEQSMSARLAKAEAKLAMYEMFFALVDVRRRIHVARAEEAAMVQGLKSTAERARALGATIPQAIAEAR